MWICNSFIKFVLFEYRKHGKITFNRYKIYILLAMQFEYGMYIFQSVPARKYWHTKTCWNYKYSFFWDVQKILNRKSVIRCCFVLIDPRLRDNYSIIWMSLPFHPENLWNVCQFSTKTWIDLEPFQIRSEEGAVLITSSCM